MSIYHIHAEKLATNEEIVTQDQKKSTFFSTDFFCSQELNLSTLNVIEIWRFSGRAQPQSTLNIADKF